MTEPVTDRDMIVQLAERVMGWENRTVFWCSEGQYLAFRSQDGIRFYPQHPSGSSSGWNPLTSPADALELEGLVPEEKWWHYGMALRESVGDESDMPTMLTIKRCRRATPRQISTAVFSVMCQEEK